MGLKMIDEAKCQRARLVAHHIIVASREKGFSYEDFERGLFVLLGWSIAGKDYNYRKALMALANYVMEKGLSAELKDWANKQ